MGYCIKTNDMDCNIKLENQDKALIALQNLAKTEKLTWIYEDEVINSKSLVEAIGACRYEAEIVTSKGEEYVCIDYFTGEKYGSCNLVFTALAPYIEDDSYIIYIGEDGEQWRYYFKDGKMEEQNAKIIWE